MSKYLNWEPEELLITTAIVPPHQLSLFKPNEWGSQDEVDLGTCPYYARYHGLPGADEHGICYQMSVCERAGEPLCITDEPRGGWPSQTIWRFYNSPGITVDVPKGHMPHTL
jgi:hypothetical protein